MSDNEINIKREGNILLETNNFESFSFIVEEKKPERGYKYKEKSPDEILKQFFKSENSFTREEFYEILHYSFETEDSFALAGDTPLIEAYRISYLYHFPIIINPSHFWLMILQGFAKHMEKNENSDRNRYKFVNFEGKKNIAIETGINLFTASDEQWNIFIQQLLNETTKVLEQSGKDLIKLFKKNFQLQQKRQR